MVVWKEREHELDFIRGANDHGNVSALWECGLIKLFKITSMRAHIILVACMHRMWNPKKQHFEVGAHILTVEVEYIYFLNEISWRGAHISLDGP